MEALINRFPHKFNMDSDPVLGAGVAGEGRHAPVEERGPRGGGTKLKVLALHGMDQCKETFQESQQKKECLAGRLKHVAELVYVDAAHVDPRPGSSMLRLHYRPEGFELADRFAWQTVQEAHCIGIEESLAYLEDVWQNHPEAPFDGVLGFSMGASMGACFVDHMQRQHGPGPRFFICCSGSYTPIPVNVPAYAAYATSETKIMTPSFHTIGKEDGVCFPELSRRLASIFYKPQVLEFDKGRHHLAKNFCHAPVRLVHKPGWLEPSNHKARRLHEVAMD